MGNKDSTFVMVFLQSVVLPLLPGSEILSRTLKATTRTGLVLKTCMNHFMSSLAGHLDVKEPTKGMERDLGPNFRPYFFSKLH